MIAGYVSEAHKEETFFVTPTARKSLVEIFFFLQLFVFQCDLPREIVWYILSHYYLASCHFCLHGWCLNLQEMRIIFGKTSPSMVLGDQPITSYINWTYNKLQTHYISKVGFLNIVFHQVSFQNLMKYSDQLFLNKGIIKLFKDFCWSYTSVNYVLQDG